MTMGRALSKLQHDIHTALQSWHETNTDTSPLDYLLLFQQAKARGAGNARQATNEILLEALEFLAIKHKADADLLRKRFLDEMMMYTVANQLNVGESTAYRKQQDAIKQLAQIIQAREAGLRHEYQAKLEKRLRLPPHGSLFGVDQQLNTLQEILLSPEPVWLVSIEGLGGIGKTALANALIRQPDLTYRFHEAAWVSAKPKEFLPSLELEQMTWPALTDEALINMLLEQLDETFSPVQSPQQKYSLLARLLKETPHLIVIDNLETVTDYQALLPVLRKLANPSKFLLTSRYSLQDHSDVFCCNLQELNQADAFHFIRHEAKTRGLSLVANASEAELKSIYETVGGNPLAIKLVIGQLAILPLPQVLDSLKQARGQKIEALYTYIYWQAWGLLDTASQQTLLVIPLTQDATLDQLLALSQLPLETLTQALERLVTLSLVQVSGELKVRRYTIHRLTETFLLKEAIKWQASS